MGVKHCPNCGARQTNNSKFCRKCGAPFPQPGEKTYEYRYDYMPSALHRPRHLPLSCIIAYIPFLFWLPLLTDRKDPVHRRSANQGLWLTITLVIYYIGLFAVYLVLDRHLGIEWTWLYRTLFFGWTPLNWFTKMPYALGCAAAGIFAITPVCNCIFGILRGLSSGQPYRIPLYGRFQLIRTIKS